MKVKIVLNKGYGGYGLSDEAIELIAKRKGINLHREEYCYFDENGDYFDVHKIPRIDEDLVYVVETLGVKRAGGICATLEIEEIDLAELIMNAISEYDGKEQLGISY